MPDDRSAAVGQGQSAAGGEVSAGAPRALVVDDEPHVRALVAEVLREEGWRVTEADSAERAFQLIDEESYALVFCDVMLPGGAEGFTVLRRLAREQPGAHIVLMTGYGSAAGALDATALGAFDYLLKPFHIAELQEVSASVLGRLGGSPRAHSAGEKTAYVHTSDLDLIGRSPALVRVMKQVGRLAATGLPVLITGESGTGKEVVARAIHRRSKRAHGPFVAVNCGALPAELIESELFGHLRGAFTGAERDRRGLFEEADGGTLFLDEVTETTPAFQVKLLRALQEGEIRRVGANRPARIDVRVLAATNREPAQEVAERRLRQDLFYRLNAVSLRLPPLRERREDIMPLARYFAARARASGAQAPYFTPESIHLLESYEWPGNIRELENAVLRAVALSAHTIRANDLPEPIRQWRAQKGGAAEAESEPGPGTAGVEEWPTLAEVEARYMARVLQHTGGNKQAAARVLNVDRKTLQRMISRHQLTTRAEANEE